MSFRRYKLILMLLFALLVSAGRAAALSLEPIKLGPYWTLETPNGSVGLVGVGPSETIVAFSYTNFIIVPLPYYVVAILIVVAVALAVVGVFWLLSWWRGKR